MKAMKFDEIVKARANQRVDEKIEKFEKACLKAAIELFPDSQYCSQYPS